MTSSRRFAVLYVLLALTGLYLHFHADMLVPAKRPFREFPARNQGWRMVSQSGFSAAVLDILKPTDYLARSYADAEGGYASLYIGFHNAGGVHTPRHCLPGNGWYRISEKETSFFVNGKLLRFVRAVYQKGEEKELFLYWYQMKGKSLSDEYSLKLQEIINSVLYRRRDLAFIRISMPLDSGEEEAYARGLRFIRDFYPSIETFLPQ